MKPISQEWVQDNTVKKLVALIEREASAAYRRLGRIAWTHTQFPLKLNHVGIKSSSGTVLSAAISTGFNETERFYWDWTFVQISNNCDVGDAGGRVTDVQHLVGQCLT
eukprot:297426-Amphidinium_carterae.1